MSATDAAWAAVPVVFWSLAWAWCTYLYRKIWRSTPRWWAVPMTHPALLLARRLPAEWEKPL